MISNFKKMNRIAEEIWIEFGDSSPMSSKDIRFELGGKAVKLGKLIYFKVLGEKGIS